MIETRSEFCRCWFTAHSQICNHLFDPFFFVTAANSVCMCGTYIFRKLQNSVVVEWISVDIKRSDFRRLGSVWTRILQHVDSSAQRCGGFLCSCSLFLVISLLTEVCLMDKLLVCNLENPSATSFWPRLSTCAIIWIISSIFSHHKCILE
jgi:hypothetical protein